MLVTLLVASFALSPIDVKKAGDGIDCDLCKFIVNEVDHLLEENKTLSFIEKEVDR